jgi:type I restriction enzyme R subunit
MFFTILDFRNATDLFADKNFNGDPIRVKPVSQDTDLSHIIDEEENDLAPMLDEVSGDALTMVPPAVRFPDAPEDGREPRLKIYVNGVNVSVLISRELYFDQQGKPITTSLKDHTKSLIKAQFASLDAFLNRWNATERKQALIAELQAQGILVEALYEAVDKEVDLFDLICHVAFDQKPLTRKERANQVKKRNYFTQYGEKARKVLEVLLDKYADEGITNIETLDVLRVRPLTDLGSPMEIIKAFGNKKNYWEAIQALEKELYKIA